jgi:hypothetical protein
MMMKDESADLADLVLEQFIRVLHRILGLLSPRSPSQSRPIVLYEQFYSDKWLWHLRILRNVR